MDEEDEKKPKKGKLLILPGGKKIDTSEIGMSSSIIGASGHVPTPDIIDSDANERDLREREAYIKKQELVQAATRGDATSEMITFAIQEITEELAHLKYERRKTAAEGKPTVQHTIARISMLRNLADVLLKRQENNRQERMDFRSPEFKKVMQEWLEFIHESMEKAGLGENDIDLVFKQIETGMASWERRIVQGAT